MKFKFLYIAFSILVLNCFTLKAQGSIDSTGTSELRIVRARSFSNDSLFFQIELKRSETSWNKFVNSTIQIVFDDSTFKFDGKSFGIECVEQKRFGKNSPYIQKVIEYIDGQYPILSNIAIPDTQKSADAVYRFTAKTLQNRFFICVQGPQNYDSTVDVPFVSKLDTGVITPFIVGTFLIYGKIIDSTLNYILPDGTNPDIGVRLFFKSPQPRFQACAFKVSKSIGEYYTSHDNVEIDEPLLNKTVNYKNDNTIKPRLVVDNFSAEYKGDNKVELQWNTSSQFQTLGWKIDCWRQNYYGGANDITYDHPLLDIDGYNIKTGKPVELKSPVEETVSPIEYPILTDTFNFIRGATYYYKLSYKDKKGRTYVKKITKVTITQTLILFTNVFPNPIMNDKATFEFILDEAAYVYASIYNINGQKAMDLIGDSQHPIEYKKQKSPYKQDFNMPQFATNGIYLLVIIAKPVHVPSTIEQSTSSLKISLVR